MDTDTLLKSLASELERPRELSAKVINYIAETYNIDREAIGAFLVGELPKLEDYEVDLILSPVFTPKLADQAVFAELLASEAIPREEWAAYIQKLVEIPTRAHLVTQDKSAHAIVLREVTIERYVHRLRLDGSIPEPLFRLLDQPLLKAIARRAVWESDGRRSILALYLANAAGLGLYRLADALDLLSLVESHQPSDVADLLARLPRWQKALRDQVGAASGPKPFFSTDVHASHGGGRDQRRVEDPRTIAKENELEFLERLQKVLGG